MGVVHPVPDAPYHEALSTNFIRLTSAGYDDDGLSIERCQEFNSFIGQTVVQVVRERRRSMIGTLLEIRGIAIE